MVSSGRARSQPEAESEEVLVERAKRDPEAFGILYQKYVDRIYQYIYYRTGDPHEAEDLTARTFFRALGNIGRYTQRGVPFSAWLYRIAHNLVANWHRDRQHRQVVALEEIVLREHSGNPGESHLEQREREEALRRAIARLSAERQQLLILKFAEGLPNTQVGQIMGRSEGAIKSLYHRTLEALRRELKSQGL
ncbi:MAG: sigma-70 family RNA polymerase sigma factor [Chloroflexi bacterium]|nr:sigma-70 family RNA polymerase sigma factor [Chloroflexota bacterium]